MVDAHFNALARQRKYEAIKAERQAKTHAAKLARIRAEFSSESKTIRIDGPIGDHDGEFGAKWLRSELPTDGRDVRLVVHSEGGSVFECLAMHDILRAYNGKVTGVVASAAFSAASLLLTACDEIQGTPNAYVMIHCSDIENPEGLSQSQRHLLAELDETMVRLYSEKTRQSPHTIRSMMQQETFMTATEAQRLGFIDSIAEPKSLRIVAKRISPKNAARVSAAARWRAAVDAKAATMPKAAAITAVDKSHPGLRAAMLREVNKR